MSAILSCLSSDSNLPLLWFFWCPWQIAGSARWIVFLYFLTLWHQQVKMANMLFCRASSFCSDRAGLPRIPPGFLLSNTLRVHNDSNFSPLASSNFWKILQRRFSVTTGIYVQGRSFWSWIHWQYCKNKSTWRTLSPSQFDTKTFL